MATKHGLVADLQALGVNAGDAVMMHSSLSALGFVEGGAETVVDALLEVVGDSGTLLVPAFRDSVWGAAENFGNTDCRCGGAGGLCASSQPGFQGVIAETVRRRAGSLRSCHPTHSWVGLGTRARELVEGHHQSATPCGRGNPFEKLVEMDGAILLLGVQVNTITLWHYYEEVLGLPYMGHWWPKERHLNHCVGGRRIQYDFPGVMQEVCRACGILRTGWVGKGASGILRARELDAFMRAILADDPYCLVLRPADRDRGDLILDALAKAAAMVRAWWRGGAGVPAAMGYAPAPVAIVTEDRMVREDCPAFAGVHAVGGRQVALCRANDRHPELYRLGGAFGTFGPATCEHCSWNQKFPREK